MLDTNISTIALQVHTPNAFVSMVLVIEFVCSNVVLVPFFAFFLLYLCVK